MKMTAESLFFMVAIPLYIGMFLIDCTLRNIREELRRLADAAEKEAEK